MSIRTHFAGTIRWLRAGYPDDAPPHGHIALLALMDARLSPEQIHMVVETVKRGPQSTADPIAIHVAIMAVSGRLPTPADVARVRSGLAAHRRSSPSSSE